MPPTPPVSGVRNGSVEIVERTQMLLQFDTPDECNAIEWIATTELQQVGDLAHNETGVVAIIQGLCGKPDLTNRIIRTDGDGFFDNTMLPQDDGNLDVKSGNFQIRIEDGVITPVIGAQPLIPIGVLSDDDRQTLSEFVDGAFTSCLLYTSPSPRDRTRSRMPSSA